MRIDPRPTTHRPWIALASAAACFLAVSVASTDPSSFSLIVGGTGLAVLGGGLTGLWARRVERRTHAMTGLGLWGSVLVVSGITIVRPGPEAIRLVGGEPVILWTVSLLAAVTTLYLGFREYGSSRHAPGTEPVIDGDV